MSLVLVGTAQAADSDTAGGALGMSESGLDAAKLSAGLLGVALLAGAASARTGTDGGTAAAQSGGGGGSPNTGPTSTTAK